MFDAEEYVEEPALSLDRYGIVFHLQYWDRRPLERSDVMLDSIEYDILSYAYRKDRPFHSEPIRVDPALETVNVRFPARTRYIAEGNERTLATPAEWLDTPEARVRTFQVCAFRTVFGDNRSRSASKRLYHGVLHIGFVPHMTSDGCAPSSRVNEYDLVKLLKLWEGGEGTSDDEPCSMQRQLAITTADGRPRTIQQLATLILEHAQILDLTDDRTDEDEVRLLAGTIQLRVGAAMWRRLYEHLGPQGLRGPSADENFSEQIIGPERWPELVAIQAILCGLLNGDLVDDAEMRDSFQLPMNLTADAMIAVNKGTVFMVSDTCRLGEELGPVVGVNPFLSVPHAVLIYNEDLLRRALNQASYADEKPTDEVRLQVVELAMRRAIHQDHLPNMFHYFRERTLFDQGVESRRLGDLHKSVEQRLDGIRESLDEVRVGKERTLQSFLELFLFILTLVQIVGNYQQLYRLAVYHIWGYSAFAMLTALIPIPVFLAANRRRAVLTPTQRLLVIVATGFLFWVFLYLWLRLLAPETDTPMGR